MKGSLEERTDVLSVGIFVLNIKFSYLIIYWVIVLCSLANIFLNKQLSHVDVGGLNSQTQMSYVDAGGFKSHKRSL